MSLVWRTSSLGHTFRNGSQKGKERDCSFKASLWWLVGLMNPVSFWLKVDFYVFLASLQPILPGHTQSSVWEFWQSCWGFSRSTSPQVTIAGCCLVYALRRCPCWGSWSQTQGPQRHLAFNLIGTFRWKFSRWVEGYKGCSFCRNCSLCERGRWLLLCSWFFLAATCWLREWGAQQRHFPVCLRAKMINRSFKSLWFLFLM